MRRAAQRLALAILCGLSSPALADWEYTYWGMQPAEVIDASRGRAGTYRGRDHDWEPFRAEVTAPYSWRNFNFTAYFLFDRQENGLSYVSLMLKTSNKCPELDARLREFYGKPTIDVKKPGFEMTSWHALSEVGVLLTFDRLEPASCELRFSRPARR